MKNTEESALEEFKLAGWSPIRNGWPDYLLFRSAPDGKMEFMGLEVKCAGDDLSDAQRVMHVALRAAGIKVVVKTVEGTARLPSLKNAAETEDLALTPVQR